MDCDVIVLGMGVMGGAACYSLARRGVAVTGIEQFGLGHSLGSSHGGTRLIRKAYFEDEHYVPLAKYSYQLWDQIGKSCEKPLLHRVGLLLIGQEKRGALKGVVSSARKHKVQVRKFSTKELRRHYPQIRAPEGYIGVLEPDAGYVEVERSVLELIRLARKHGADIHEEERVEGWSATSRAVTVRTSRATYKARHLIIAAGPWSASLLGESNKLQPLEVRRVPQFWLKAPAEFDEKKKFPCYALDLPDGFFYGVPRKGKRPLKMAIYHPKRQVVTDPYIVEREIHPSDYQPINEVVRTHLIKVNPIPQSASVCLYTMAPNSRFIIDLHPRYKNVSFATGFSGHGFKFAPAVGECLAKLAISGTTLPAARFLKLPPPPKGKRA